VPTPRVSVDPFAARRSVGRQLVEGSRIRQGEQTKGRTRLGDRHAVVVQSRGVTAGVTTAKSPRGCDSRSGEAFFSETLPIESAASEPFPRLHHESHQSSIEKAVH
jgi:hypothetical protein